MDASQYKDYVLVLLFIKYVSNLSTTKPRGYLATFRTSWDTLNGGRFISGWQH